MVNERLVLFAAFPAWKTYQVHVFDVMEYVFEHEQGLNGLIEDVLDGVHVVEPAGDTTVQTRHQPFTHLVFGFSYDHYFAIPDGYFSAYYVTRDELERISDTVDWRSARQLDDDTKPITFPEAIDAPIQITSHSELERLFVSPQEFVRLTSSR